MTIAVYVFLAASAVVLLSNLLYLRDRSGSAPAVDHPPLVSVLVPARDEEQSLPACLDSLLAQDWPALEILVLDDHSADRTAGIAAEYACRRPERMRVVPASPLPEGWTGKNWACRQLARQARGEWLVFTDADTVHAPDSISRAYRAALRRGASLVSYLPDLITVGLGERIVMPVLYFAFCQLFPLGLIARLRDPLAAVAVGTFILVRTSTYRRAGGHEAIRAEIVDDICLTRKVKELGERTDMISGIGVLYSRFYASLREIWEGFTKNAFGAFGYSVLPYLATLFFAYTIFLHPFVELLLVQPLRGVPWSLSSPWLRQAVVILALRLVVAVRTRHSLLSLVFHPLMILFSLLFAANSLWRIARGLPMAWKGREYPVRR